MNFWNRWRILPQVGFVLVLIPGSVSAQLLSLPPTPSTPDQARAFLQKQEGFRQQAEELIEQKESQCRQRIMVSPCLRELEADKSRLRRDLQVSEKASKDLLRQEELRFKGKNPAGTPPATPGAGTALQQPVPQLSQPSTQPAPDPVGAQSDPPPVTATPSSPVPNTATNPPERADAPDIAPRRTPRDPAQSQPSAANGNGRGSDTGLTQRATPPAVSEQQQAENRAAYEARQQAAKQRAQQNALRLEQVEQQRAEYRRKQAELLEKAERRAQAAKKAKEQAAQ